MNHELDGDESEIDFSHLGDDEIDQGNPIAAELTEATDEKRNAYREAARRAQDFYRTGFAVVKEFRGDRGFAFDCFLLALNWLDILGVDSQVKLADKWGCSKENVRKLVDDIQNKCGIPTTPSQRSAKGRAKMSARRKSQLKTTTTKP